ncbi:MAG TPA: GNAT family N-acetyltransferase [Thermoplasmata archaeon]|jgi:ribosomal protein S18 acetylase RimI-like enzyme
MATAASSQYTTEELSPETWPDFDKLFAKHGGVQAGCWCVFYQRPGPISEGNIGRGGRAARNRRDKKALVMGGRSHGILVYAGRRPVGWCEYGPKEELPRIDAGRNYRKLALGHPKRLWRIACFFVDRDFRRRGVAQIALRAALDSIKRRGGGIVEAYPATHPRAVAVWFGSVGMFEREQFKTVAALGRSNILMRREV